MKLFVLSIFLSLFASPAFANESLYDIPYKSIEGKETSLKAYKGRVLLLVNSASECGYTNQYDGLEKLYKTHEAKGLTIVAFPSESFDQELKSDGEVEKFCRIKFGVTFPLSTRISVAGKDVHPLFQYLTAKAPEKGAVKWNFEKFLIDRKGKIVARYPSGKKPEEIEADIKKLL